MNPDWSATCSALPPEVALLLLMVCVILGWWWSPRHGPTRWLRVAAVMVAIGLLADPAISRTTTASSLPPVAVVIDTSASMGIADRHLSSDRLCDLAEALAMLAPGTRSVAPRDLGLALNAFQTDLAGAEHLSAARWRVHASALQSAAERGVGYREAEALSRRLAQLASTAAAHPEEAASSISLMAAEAGGLAAVLPRLAAEQAASDAALIAQWRGQPAGTPEAKAAAAIDALAATPRGQLAQRLVTEVIVPRLQGYAELSFFALSDHVIRTAPERLQPGNGGTDLAAISELARSWSGGRTPGAVILLSDGRNFGGDPRPALRALAARGARLVTLTLGGDDAPDTPALLDLSGPPLARAQARLALDAQVRLTATADWELVVSLAGTELKRLPVPSGTGLTRIRVGLDSGPAGLRRFQARLIGRDQQHGPWLTCPVRVSDAASRVLVIDGPPRWESRALVAALEADPAISVERRYLQGPGAVERALPPGGLTGLDAVVLGDVTASEFSLEDQAQLGTFVAEGGFLIAIAGPRGMPTGFPLGVLADLLPVRPARNAPDGRATLVVTDAGLTHPLLRLIGDSDTDRRLWTALPAPGRLIGGMAAHPAATVLVEAVTAPGNGIPAVAIRETGLGRVLWLGTPETWRWRSIAEGRAHLAFWQGALAWGTARLPRGDDNRLRMSLTPDRCSSDEAAEVLALATEDGTPSTDVTDDDGSTIPCVLQQVGAHRWRTVLTGLDEGLHRITVTHRGLREQRDLLIRPRAWRELADTAADPLALATLAADCGGQATDAAGLITTLAELKKQLKPESNATTTTWTATGNPWLGVVLLSLLTLEWILRKRRGLP